MRPREIAGAPVPPRPSKEGGGDGEGKLIPRRCINNSRGGSAPPSAGGILASVSDRVGTRGMAA
jgi:hypothetical protein